MGKKKGKPKNERTEANKEALAMVLNLIAGILTMVVGLAVFFYHFFYLRNDQCRFMTGTMMAFVLFLGGVLILIGGAATIGYVMTLIVEGVMELYLALEYSGKVGGRTTHTLFSLLILTG